MLKKNFLKEKLESGQSVIGTWATIPSTITTDIIASTGIDFIIIDAEHGPISFETAQNMVITCESQNVSPVMRVGTIDEADILKALDIGVHCIQIPNVNSKKDVEKIVEFSKYPPIGERGFSPFTRAGNYSIKNSKSLTEDANKNTMIAINIEGKEAIEDIDNILKIKELDIIFIGLFDLSKALGIPGDVDNPKVINYLKELTIKINGHGKYAGTITTSKEKITQFLDIGVKYIVHLVDCEMLRNSYSEIVKHFNTNTK
tara:strand:- start:8898 stop:9674 length:777 start_codon:yes stop_codon:yes gene_type:complete